MDRGVGISIHHRTHAVRKGLHTAKNYSPAFAGISNRLQMSQRSLISRESIG